MLLFVSLNTCRGFFIISSQYWIPSYCCPSVVKLWNFTWPWRGKLNKVIQGKNKSSLFVQMSEIFGEIVCFRLMWTTWVEQEIFFRQNLQKSILKNHVPSPQQLLPSRCSKPVCFSNKARGLHGTCSKKRSIVFLSTNNHLWQGIYRFRGGNDS